MNWKTIESIVNGIEDRYICEAAEYAARPGKFRRRFIGRAGRAAACIAGIVMMSASSLALAAAAGSLPAYDILCGILPETAKKLAPVHLSCEDNGIRMEVEAVHIQEDTAYIYISLQDLEGERIDETCDLFDSYSIRSSGDSVETCTRAAFDAQSGKTLFLIQIEQADGKKLEGQRLIFSVSELLNGKQKLDERLEEVSLENLEEKTELQTEISERGISMAGGGTLPVEQIRGFLKEDENQAFSPVEGVTVTAWGMVDGRLHIQAHYENIRETDNHGCLYLKDQEGNSILSSLSVSFWDKEQTGSYEEYIFEAEEIRELEQCSVWGYFSTGGERITGNWKVEFPVENLEVENQEEAGN